MSHRAVWQASYSNEEPDAQGTGTEEESVPRQGWRGPSRHG